MMVTIIKIYFQRGLATETCAMEVLEASKEGRGRASSCGRGVAVADLGRGVAVVDTEAIEVCEGFRCEGRLSLGRRLLTSLFCAQFFAGMATPTPFCTSSRILAISCMYRKSRH